MINLCIKNSTRTPFLQKQKFKITVVKLQLAFKTLISPKLGTLQLSILNKQKKIFSVCYFVAVVFLFFTELTNNFIVYIFYLYPKSGLLMISMPLFNRNFSF